jgi:hypothetical protein
MIRLISMGTFSLGLWNHYVGLPEQAAIFIAAAIVINTIAIARDEVLVQLLRNEKAADIRHEFPRGQQ